MSDVTLSVGGRNYTIACADGDEDRVRSLAETVDAKLAAMGAKLTTPMEAKNLLIAGLILADELDEAKKGQPVGGSAPGPSLPPKFAEGLESIADRLEKSAQLLERGPQSA